MQVEEAKGREKRKNQRNTIGTQVVLQKTDVLPKWDRKPSYQPVFRPLHTAPNDLPRYSNLPTRACPWGENPQVCCLFSIFLVWAFSQCRGMHVIVKCFFLLISSQVQLCVAFSFGVDSTGIFGGDKHNTLTYSSLVWQFLATRICESCSEIRWCSPKKDNFLHKKSCNSSTFKPGQKCSRKARGVSIFSSFFSWDVRCGVFLFLGGGCGVERRILPIHVKKNNLYVYHTCILPNFVDFLLT